MSVDVAIDVRAQLGEGPRWDAPHAASALGRHRRARAARLGSCPRRATERSRSTIGPAPRRRWRTARVLVALADRLVALDLEDGSLETLCPSRTAPTCALNDGACDPAGRFWVGTWSSTKRPDRAALYRYDRTARSTPSSTASALSNGLAWSPEAAACTTSTRRRGRIDVFDYDLATGTASDRRPFAVIERGAAMPDGLAIDDEGGVWVALRRRPRCAATRRTAARPRASRCRPRT